MLWGKWTSWNRCLATFHVHISEAQYFAHCRNSCGSESSPKICHWHRSWDGVPTHYWASHPKPNTDQQTCHGKSFIYNARLSGRLVLKNTCLSVISEVCNHSEYVITSIFINGVMICWRIYTIQCYLSIPPIPP